jgi:hypothetical protein
MTVGQYLEARGREKSVDLASIAPSGFIDGQTLEPR